MGAAHTTDKDLQIRYDFRGNSFPVINTPALIEVYETNVFFRDDIDPEMAWRYSENLGGWITDEVFTVSFVRNDTTTNNGNPLGLENNANNGYTPLSRVVGAPGSMIVIGWTLHCNTALPLGTDIAFQIEGQNTGNTLHTLEHTTASLDGQQGLVNLSESAVLVSPAPFILRYSVGPELSRPTVDLRLRYGIGIT